VLLRYRAERWVVITGTIGGNDPYHSTFDFMSTVFGYDLAGFFERNSEILRQQIHQIVTDLLSPEAR
jgi:hypothetical protein